MTKIIWHPLAMEDLRMTITYCQQEFGKSIARKVRDKLKHDASLLASHPKLGHPEDDLNSENEPLIYRSLLSGMTKIVVMHCVNYLCHIPFVTLRNDKDSLHKA